MNISENSSPTRTLRVLVVEDEPRLRDLLLDVLPDMGFPEPTGTRSAEDALRLMEADPRDLILLDLNLPMMGGMDFFSVLKTRWPATQVIVMTAFGSLEAARQAIHLDVVDFLSKPCPLSEIEQALERARRRVHGSERETIATNAVQLSNEDDDSKAGSRRLEEMEREQILTALQRNGGNRTLTATQLGISRRTLHYRLSEYRKRGWVAEH